MAIESSGIEHAVPECTGEWRLVVREGRRVLACDGCGVEHAPTPGRRQAAADENIAGAYLRRLTSEGRDAAA